MDSRLAAVIVHDIKNALGVLESELQRMTVDPTRDRAVAAHGTCASLREKLIGFLILYKASSQGLAPHVEALNPEEFVIALLRNRVTDRPDLRVSIDTGGMPVLGFFDENLVGLALEAALQNATRFARSAIEISCTKAADGYLTFAIRDDGPGPGTREDTPSTGLGMELCNAIAQAHRKGDNRGSVLLHNHPGGGALFELRLP